MGMIASVIAAFALWDLPDIQVTQIRFYPAAGKAAEMVRGRFTGSNSSPTNDFETLAEIQNPPKEGAWTVINLKDARRYRYLKYEGIWNTAGTIAELEFWAGTRKLKGVSFSTVAQAGKSASAAFDGDTNTAYVGAEANSQYVGIDLGPASQVATPLFLIPGGSYPAPVSVGITTSTPGSTVRFNLGGQTPSEDWGDAYSGPIKLAKSSVLVARAFHPKLAPSVVIVAPYRIGGAAASKLVRTFHIGNSLTDTVVPWMEPIASAAGGTLEFHRFTIPGAPTDWLWEHPGQGFGDARYLEAFAAYAPIDHIFTQPFAGHNRSVENEADYGLRFYEAARKHSPDVRPWIYVQWPTAKLDDPWSRGEGAAKGLPGVKMGAKTFGDAVDNFNFYAFAVRAKMMTNWKGKPIGVVPGGFALALLKESIDKGAVPGMTDLFKDCFSDDLHLNTKGAYLVSLVHYACIYRQSPEGKVGPLNSGLTAEQAKIFERIAWRAVLNTPFAQVK